MRAFEIEPTKLVMPFADIDKANMPHFQFNAQDVKQEKTLYQFLRLLPVGTD